MSFRKTITERGFGYIEFQDANGQSSSIQVSSAISDNSERYLWLGLNDADPQILCSKAEENGVQATNDTGWQSYPIPEDVFLSTRMHLSKEHVKGLIAILQEWLEEGDIGVQGQDIYNQSI